MLFLEDFGAARAAVVWASPPAHATVDSARPGVRASEELEHVVSGHRSGEHCAWCAQLTPEILLRSDAPGPIE